MRTSRTCPASGKTNPKTYTKPFTHKLGLNLLPDTDVLENFCVEDEKDAAHMKN